MKFDLDHVPEEIFWDLSEDEAIELGMPWWGKIICWCAYALQFISPFTLPVSLGGDSGNGFSVITAPIFFLGTVIIASVYGTETVLLSIILLPFFMFLLFAFVNNHLVNYYFERGLEVLVKRYYEERER